MSNCLWRVGLHYDLTTQSGVAGRANHFSATEPVEVLHQSQRLDLDLDALVSDARVDADVSEVLRVRPPLAAYPDTVSAAGRRADSASPPKG